MSGSWYGCSARVMLSSSGGKCGDHERVDEESSQNEGRHSYLEL